MKGRLLALDLGRKRVGVAVSDPLGITAQPLPPLKISGLKSLMLQLAILAKHHQVSGLVLGNPCRLDGSPGPMAEFVAQAKSRIESELGLPVHLFDERFTSKMAQQVIHLSGRRLKDNKTALDSISASIILSDYLKSTGHENTD
jgi:putative Holliday junction resolvase